ncbi:MAG: ABC transporter permease [Flavobacteriales bacterium]|nr:ABC transporter permease [Flavobacteriales bacterium]
MNLFRLSVRNMTSRPLSTTLSLVLLTLGVGMIALLVQVDRHIQQQLQNNIGEIDMVVGAKGSPLQLILSAVYHIDKPTGNISLQEAQKLKRNRLVEAGIPLSYGDSHQGFRIVGTDQQYPELYKASVVKGALWQKPFEVTLGATVAMKLGLDLGDTFTGSHGLVDGGDSHGEHPFEVVGIFGYTNSVLDQLILTATESVWLVHHHEAEITGIADAAEEPTQEEHAHEHEDTGHVHAEGWEVPDEDQQITAMLVKFRGPMGMVQLPRLVNERTNMQAAVPAFEISRLFSLMAVGVDMLSAIARLIMMVAGLSVFISLYNALRDRQYEMALMRTYGATRWQLVQLVVQEGLLLTLTGSLLGLLFSRIGLWLVSGLMEANYHYAFGGWVWAAEEGWLLATALAIGLLASLLPAIRVFRINISKTLADA